MRLVLNVTTIMNKVIRDNKVAVLLSPTYGIGFYTQYEDSPGSKNLLFDPVLVGLVESTPSNERNADWFKKFNDRARELLPEDACYVDTDSSDIICIAWVECGKRFIVKECDGSETIEIEDDMDWVVA